MKGFKFFSLNLILFLALIGGIFMVSPIKGFATSSNSYSGQITRVFYSSSYSGVPSDGHTYKCKVTNSTWSMFFVGHTGESYSDLTGEVYLLTTSGTYLLGVAGGSNSSVTVANANSSRYFDGYPLKLFGILRGFVTSSSQPGAHSSGSLSFSASVVDTTGTNEDLTSIKSDTSQILSIVQGLNFDSIYDLVADIWVYLDTNQRSQFANILSTLISMDVSLESIDDTLIVVDSSLKDILSNVLLLKKSLCFDFPYTIDGNYQLATVFYNTLSSNITNNNPLSLGYCGFDFSSFYNCSLVVRVPVSHKLLFVANRLNNGTIVYPNTFKDDNGNSFSISYDNTSRTSSSYALYIDLPSSLVPGSFISFDVVRNNVSSPISVRFAFYDYVVSANDILDYMQQQWNGADVVVDPFLGDVSGADNIQNNIHIIESGSWSDLNSNYSYTGLGSFTFNAFTGMSTFTTIINQFYLKLPSQYALYIVGCLFIGISAVLISAVGRVNKVSDGNIRPKGGKKG